MSEASSEISDDALDKLVSRLVEVAEEDGSMQSPVCSDASVSAGSSGDEKVMGAATGPPIWPSSTPDPPSPIQPRRSPRPDGFDQEADSLASASASEGEQPRPPQATGTSGDRDDTSLVEGDDVVKRACNAKGEDEEASDVGVGKRDARPHVHVKLVQTTHQVDEESPWEALNSSLREQGFREVSLTWHDGSVAVPDPTSVADTLRDVVFKHGEREKVIQEMSLELQRLNNVSGHRDSVLNDSFRREKSNLSRRSAGAEARVAALEEEKELLKSQVANLVRRLTTETASLSSQLKQSEHRVKAKEAAVQKLMDKLQDEAEKERLSQQRERAVLTKFQRKHTLRGGSADDSRVAESLMAHYSKAQRRSEAEVDDLRAEVSRLGDDLREKENTILKHRLGPDWTPDLDQAVRDTATSDELRDLRARLAESERSVGVMKQRERRAQERYANMEEQCVEIQAKADETQEALVNAQLELTSRPSLRNWRASQRRIKELEAKLSQATAQVKEAVGVAELRRWVDTGELIRRDRENHRLKLDRLEELPLDILKTVVQDSCRLLALQDVSLLSSSVSKLIKAVSLLPRLERFVNSVCSFVFRHSPEDPLAKKGRTMEDVLPLLEVWLARAQAPLKLKGFRLDLLSVLETRTGGSQDAPPGPLLKRDQDVLNAVRHLVECERKFLREEHQNEQAGRSLTDPSPINRVVRHFQLLFGVTTIEGCLPKLNELHRFSSETQTFLRTCGDLLNMSSNSNTAIMRRLETLLEGRTSFSAQDCLLRVSHDAESWPKS